MSKKRFILLVSFVFCFLLASPNLAFAGGGGSGPPPRCLLKILGETSHGCFELSICGVVIEVCEDECEEGIVVDGQTGRVNCDPLPPDSPLIDGVISGGSAAGVEVVGNITLRNFTIKDNQGCGIVIMKGSPIIENCIFENNGRKAIAILNRTGTTDEDDTYITTPSQPIIRNNVIIDDRIYSESSGAPPISLQDYSSARIENNIIKAHLKNLSVIYTGNIKEGGNKLPLEIHNNTFYRDDDSRTEHSYINLQKDVKANISGNVFVNFPQSEVRFFGSAQAIISNHIVVNKDTAGYAYKTIGMFNPLSFVTDPSGSASFWWDRYITKTGKILVNYVGQYDQQELNDFLSVLNDGDVNPPDHIRKTVTPLPVGSTPQMPSAPEVLLDVHLQSGSCDDVDKDGYYGTAGCGTEVDFDDTYANSYPGAPEICGDNKDNDNDGQVDGTGCCTASNYYLDADSDGYGNPDELLQACSQPSGYVADNTDCNDTRGDIRADCVPIYEFTVPDDYSTIQAAINAASADATIIVRNGIYKENINFNGQPITVRSENGPYFTTIEASNIGSSVVTFTSGESENSILEGFTITGAGDRQANKPDAGGGIYCDGASSPTIKRCLITNNYADTGGGIYISQGSPKIIN